MSDNENTPVPDQQAEDDTSGAPENISESPTDDGEQGAQGVAEADAKEDEGAKEENVVEESTPNDAEMMAEPEAEDSSDIPKTEEEETSETDNQEGTVQVAAGTEGAVENNLKGSEQSEEEKSNDTMDTDDVNAAPSEQVEDPATKEPSYSTRGRSEKEANSGAENWDSKSRETLDDIGRKESASVASLATSFLESLTEEERRMRTRFLPDVDGMHTLRKREVKEDLAMARALVSSAGVTSLKKSKGKRDSMDTGDDDGASPSEDDRSSDISRLGTSTIELSSRDLVLPSNAFVAPPGTKSADDSESQINSSPSNGIQSPMVVDNVVAFNPPRPPESIGAKKKHRMLRWERRPEDVESDLNNYRKTVQRTRQELHNAESEYQRLETIDAHLRWHFLSHLDLLNEEYNRLNDEMGSVQDDCVNAADLLTSRTRSRGASKGGQVMRDVLAALKIRGTEATAEDAMETEVPGEIPEPSSTIGIGGLPLQAFSDWSQDTKIASTKPASYWLVAGDKVKTPYGEGTVLKVYPPSVEKTSEKDALEGNENGEKKTSNEGDNAGKKEQPKQDTNTKAEESESQGATILPPRVSVSFPYGTGYLNITEVSLLENPSIFSDIQLEKRWKSMAECALSVSGALDIGGMFEKSVEKDHTAENEDEEGMDLDGPAGDKDVTQTNGDTGSAKSESENARFLPFGSGLMPTSYGRGLFFNNLSLEEVEKEMHNALYEGEGVLGRPTNPGVPKNVKKWEEEEQESLTLQAALLQLKNSLYRQRRIRLMNERTSNASNERYARAETLVTEMRADLKTLKQRLDEELVELGIDDEAQEKILSSFYRGDDAEENMGEISPLKRQRSCTQTQDDFSQGGSDLDRESLDDQDLSGDDLEAQRAAKKVKPNQ